jgi:hypothetical protein
MQEPTQKKKKKTKPEPSMGSSGTWTLRGSVRRAPKPSSFGRVQSQKQSAGSRGTPSGFFKFVCCAKPPRLLIGHGQNQSPAAVTVELFTFVVAPRIGLTPHHAAPRHATPRHATLLRGARMPRFLTWHPFIASPYRARCTIQHSEYYFTVAGMSAVARAN